MKRRIGSEEEGFWVKLAAGTVVPSSVLQCTRGGRRIWRGSVTPSQISVRPLHRSRLLSFSNFTRVLQTSDAFYPTRIAGESVSGGGLCESVQSCLPAPVLLPRSCEATTSSKVRPPTPLSDGISSNAARDNPRPPPRQEKTPNAFVEWQLLPSSELQSIEVSLSVESRSRNRTISVVRARPLKLRTQALNTRQRWKSVSVPASPAGHFPPIRSCRLAFVT